MRLAVNDIHREPLGSTTVDEKVRPLSATLDGSNQCVELHWEEALDARGRLRRCPVCGCREIFKRYDFPQRFGLLLVISTVVGAVALIAMWQVLWAMLLLIGAVVVDRIIYVFTGQCLVCYRCRSEFRDVTIDETHEAWDLAIGEKYRPLRQNQSDEVKAQADQHHPSTPLAPSLHPHERKERCAQP